MRISKAEYPYCYAGHKYAEDVVQGKRVECIYVIGACQRYLKEVEDKYSDTYYYDIDAAERFLRLVQKFEHVIGEWETPHIKFEPWQCFIWMNIMGFKNHETDLRRFRIAHIEVARGNAKSTMASTAALFFLALDDSKGNMIATAATKKDQARIVLDSSRAMAMKNKSFLRRKGVDVRAHEILQPKTNSKMRALSSEAKSLDGLNDILAILDELHAMNRETFEVIYSGMIKRKDSLTLCITTAGFDMTSVGFSQSEYIKKLLTEEGFEDDQFFGIVYTLDKDDDVFDPAVWPKANPNWDISVDALTFAARMKKAEVTPADLSGLKVKNLNMWLSEAHAFFNVTKWDECADPTLRIEDFKGKVCRMGVDLSSHLDLTSRVVIFKEDDIYYFFDKSYLPEETLKQQRNTLYDDCVARGFLISTQGVAINNKQIQKEIEEFADNHRVMECMYDTWNATEMANNLAEKIEMVKFAMNVGNFSEPMKKLDTLIREKRIRHNGSPLLRWAIGNVVAKRDHNDNVFPRKNHEKLKIDPIVAGLMALAGWLGDDTGESVYETRGLRSI